MIAPAYTLAEDESTCIVYGMPKEAVRLNAVDEVVPLYQMAQAIVGSLVRPGRRAAAGVKRTHRRILLQPDSTRRFEKSESAVGIAGGADGFAETDRPGSGTHEM